MNIFERYETEFRELVDVAFAVSRKHIVSTDNAFAKHLILTMDKMKNLRAIKIEKRDIEQQLALLWLEWHRQFRAKKPKSHLKNYLMRRSVWGLRDWLRKEMAGPTGVTILRAVAEEKGHLFDLHWLLHGDEAGPLFMLSSYERYLLFLRYVQGLTIDDMARTVHKGRKKVMSSLKELIGKIRSYSNAETITSGSCHRGDGIQATSNSRADRFSGD